MLKKKFIKKVTTKKAYTLVELIVTVAILSITAGFGIGIFTSAMGNYSTASIRAKEQEKALEIESFILRYARLSSDVYFVTSDGSKNTKNTDHTSDNVANLLNSKPSAVGGIISCDHTNPERLTYYDRYAEITTPAGGGSPTTEIKKGAEFQLDGVKDIKFQLYKQKADNTEGINDTFAYLNYNIEMPEGYSIKGNVMLYNCQNVTFNTSSAYTVTTADGEFTLCDMSYDTAIAFLQQ